MKNIYVAILVLFISSLTFGQTLSAGDIALLQYNADGDEIIKFLALNDLPAGEEIKFTDNGWLASGSLRGGEGTFTYTVPAGGISCGTVVTIDLTGPALSSSGDQLLVYQGLESSPTFITALNSEGAGIWQADATNSNTSAIPTGLTNGIDAVALNEIDNAIYTGTLSGTIEQLRTAINNNTNWSGDDATVQDFTGTFSISDCSGGTSNPTVSFDAPTSSENETNAPFTTTIPVSMSNFDAAPVTVSVTVTGGSAEPADYTLNTSSLIFTANETQNISLDVNPDAGFDDETVILDIAVTSGTADLGTSQHTLTINDDDTPPLPAIIITEIMQNPLDVSDNNGEYFEVFNNGAAVVDLNGWTISDAGTDSHVIGSSVIVPAKGFAVLGINSTSATNGGVTVDYEYSGFGLANGDDEIILTDASSNEIDRVEYDGGTLWPDPDGAAMVFTGTATDNNNDGSQWTTATVAAGLDNDFGSPGLNGLDQEVLSRLIYVGGSWAGGKVPDATTEEFSALIIDGTYEINSLVRLGSMEVTENGAVDLTTSGTLEIDRLRFDSESNAYACFLLDGTLTAKKVIYARFTAPVGPSGTNDLIASPFTGEPFGNFADDREVNLTNLPASGNLRAFAPFNPISGNYKNYDIIADASVEIVPGKGYRAGTQVGTKLQFSGTVATGNVPVTLTDGTASFWNLTGNPYPTFLSANDFLTNNSGNLRPTFVAIYGYNGNNTGGQNTRWTEWDLNTTDIENLLIAPGQGFFVAAQPSGSTITYTEGMRRIATGDDFIPGRAANLNLANATINLISNGTTDRTNFYFRDFNTRGLDLGYDTGAFEQTANGIYSQLVEENEGIALVNQSLPYADLTDILVPLVVNSNQGTQISFSLANNANLPEGTQVFLEDTAENTVTLLNTGDYTLTPATDLNGSGRFFLRFTNSALSVASNTFDTISIYTTAQDRSIIVSGLLNETTAATIFDMQGRIVKKASLQSGLSSQAIETSGLTSGVYVVKLANSIQSKTEKVILN